MTFRSLSEFIATAQVMPDGAATCLRERFIELRVDSRSPRAADALRLHHFADGSAYTGYLWDYLADKRVIAETELWAVLGAIRGFYVMADIHSSELVRVSTDFLLPRGAVIQVDTQNLRDGLEFLPEDLYAFDESCQWAGVLTHEWIGTERFCLWSGRLPNRVPSG